MLYLVQSTFKLISSNAFTMQDIQAFFDRVIKVNLQSPVAILRQEAVKGLVLAAIMRRVISNV